MLSISLASLQHLLHSHRDDHQNKTCSTLDGHISLPLCLLPTPQSRQRWRKWYSTQAFHGLRMGRSVENEFLMSLRAINSIRDESDDRFEFCREPWRQMRSEKLVVSCFLSYQHHKSLLTVRRRAETGLSQ